MSYTPYNCVKIIKGDPPQGGAELPGCLYKNYNGATLGMLLVQLNIGSGVDRNAILLHKRDGHYQLASARHFEVAHPGTSLLGGTVNLNGVSNHPNVWFMALVLYHNAKAGKA